MKIGIFGSGAWGTALGQVLCDNGHRVLIYGRTPEEVDDINRDHRNSRYFGEVPLTPALAATTDITAVAGFSDALLFAVPSGAFGEVLRGAEPYIGKETLLINAAKGFERGRNKRLSECMREAFAARPHGGIASLIGPSHAEEVIRRMLTSVAAVSEEAATAERVQALFSNEYFRVYVCTDEVGAEYGVAIKNVIALASGMLEGRGYGDNAKAALITRGLREMVRYGTAKGGRAETFFGLTGVGDLIVTCFSPHSRNYQAGLRIGRENSATVLSEISATVEGVYSCRAVFEDAEACGIEMPIVGAVYRVLFCGAAPGEEISGLMCRPLKAE